VGFLIDTNIWVALERRIITAADLNSIIGRDKIFVSPINIAELQYGLEMIEDVQLRSHASVGIRKLRRNPFLKITAETGVVFGRLSAQLTKSGRDVRYREQDLWLAAQAIQRKFRLATANGKDFRDIPGLNLVVVKIPDPSDR
jgi:predicted nucleic acid-binding protein